MMTSLHGVSLIIIYDPFFCKWPGSYLCSQALWVWPRFVSGSAVQSAHGRIGGRGFWTQNPLASCKWAAMRYDIRTEEPAATYLNTIFLICVAGSSTSPKSELPLKLLAIARINSPVLPSFKVIATLGSSPLPDGLMSKCLMLSNLILTVAVPPVLQPTRARRARHA